MASSLSLASSSLSFPTIYAPPPSQDPSMRHILVPDVFVTPPEEEQHENPPWCYFDAAEAAKDCFSTTPDIDTLRFALDFHQQTHNPAPAFHRALGNDSQETVVMPKKGGALRRPESLTGSEREDGVRIRVLDEEIVEVVKVRRNEGMADVGEVKGQMKKSMTFRARATEAFRSIKNLNAGKGTRRPVTDTWTAQENIRQSRSEDIQDRGTLPHPSTPNLSRRKSAVFAQFFTFSQNNKSTAPSADYAEPPMSPTSSASMHRNSVNSMHSLNSTPPSLSTSSSSHAQRLHPSPSLEDCIDTSKPSGRTSPTPTLSKRKSFRHRLSVLDLQRLFTSNSASSVADEHAPPSTSPSRPPELFVDIFSNSDSRPYSLQSSDLSPSSSTPSSFASSSSISGRASPSTFHIDTDTEMRLDSLHFDSLHFDPDEFCS